MRNENVWNRLFLFRRFGELGIVQIVYVPARTLLPRFILQIFFVPYRISKDITAQLRKIYTITFNDATLSLRRERNGGEARMSISMNTGPRLSRRSVFFKGSSTQQGLPVSGSLEPSLLEKRISDAFAVFDNAGSHEVDVRELGTIIRSLGCVISEAELQEIQVQVEDVENNCVTQERFVAYMSKAICEQKFKPADPEDLLKAFQLLDPQNRGYVTRTDLEKAMMEIGEPFTKEEIEEMMTVACDPQTKNINYEHYINLLIINYPRDKNVYDICDDMETARLAALPKKRTLFQDLT